MANSEEQESEEQEEEEEEQEEQCEACSNRPEQHGQHMFLELCVAVCEAHSELAQRFLAQDAVASLSMFPDVPLLCLLRGAEVSDVVYRN